MRNGSYTVVLLTLLFLLSQFMIPYSQQGEAAGDVFLVFGFVEYANGQSLDGVLINGSGSLGEAWANTTSDGNGYYQIQFNVSGFSNDDDLVDGEDIVVQASNEYYTLLESVSYNESKDFAWLNLTFMPSLFFINGTIEDLEGQPLAGARVNASDRINPIWTETYTTLDGAFTLAFPKEELPPTEHLMGVDVQYGNISSDSTINYTEGDDEAWLNLTLQTPYYVRGVIGGYGGQPLAGISVGVLDTVTDVGDDVVTVSNGSYEARIYDFNPYDEIRVVAWTTGGSEEDHGSVSPVYGESWVNMSLEPDLQYQTWLDPMTAEPGERVNLTISISNEGNLDTDKLFLNMSSPLLSEEEEFSDDINKTGTLRYELVAGSNMNHSLRVSFSVPDTAVDGSTYPIGFTLEGRDAALISLPILQENYTVAVSRSAISPSLSPRHQDILWGEIATTTLIIENQGSQEARWVWAEATLPEGLGNTTLNWTLEHVGTSQSISLPLNISLTQPISEGTILDVEWIVRFTNASSQGMITLHLNSTLEVRAVEVDVQYSHGSVAKGDEPFPIHVSINAITPTVPGIVWANITTLDLEPLSNSTIVFYNTSEVDYVAIFYVPLLPSNEPISLIINVETAMDNGWKGESMSKTVELLLDYHYIQGNITDASESWDGPVTLINTATGDALETSAKEGFYRFDLTLLSSTSYPYDLLRISANNVTGELINGYGPVQWLDLDITKPSTETNDDGPYTSFILPGALILILVLVLLSLALRRKKVENHEVQDDEEYRGQNNRYSDDD